MLDSQGRKNEGSRVEAELDARAARRALTFTGKEPLKRSRLRAGLFQGAPKMPHEEN
jgi:hypothetical protein